MLKINEFFHSIQGESTLAGLPMVFVRLTGCNLRCTYCDTKYSYFDGEKMTLDQVIEKIESFNCRSVCITGGEPLLQKEILEVMKILCDKSYLVSLETSGSLSIKDVDPRVKTILDVKTPDSGAKDSFLSENLQFLTGNTEFKFVICTENDFQWAENFLEENKIFQRHVVLYSPSFGEISEKWLAKKNSSKKVKSEVAIAAA